MNKDTVISGKLQLYKCHEFFEEATGKKLADCELIPWIKTQEGKTLAEAVPAYVKMCERKSMQEILPEERFEIISEADKAFILAFDEGIQRLGYDFGGGIGDGYCWGKYMVIYAKTGAKTKKAIARIFIRETSIALRLFLNNIDKHAEYIQRAPGHIKETFTNSYGDCSCNPQKDNCRMRKTYTIDGEKREKCSGVVFEFWSPTVEKCSDYIQLLEEFYPVKKSKSAKI